ncbi:MAG: MBL fold metallo-hydrolase [Nitrososphaerota archaeon]|nr:MBL fold metallo-hydrolase [Nitrososphaerota archaeon]MDG6923024.1 MBL fold metallo-hydrolase [Nitrososphaerota archaeon]
MYGYKGVEITWLGHDGFLIQDGSESLVIDPFKLTRDERADFVLLSHEHFDHCNVEDLKKVLKQGSTVVAIESCRAELAKVSPKEIKMVKPGDEVRVGGFEVRAIPAYNTNKYREPGKPFHPKEEGKVGYIIKTKSGVTIYHTGDTDLIPEMNNLAPDIALIPVSGTYVMTVDEALQAVTRIKPKVAIPMHYGAIVGSSADAEKFKNKAQCEVHILTRE